MPKLAGGKTDDGICWAVYTTRPTKKDPYGRAQAHVSVGDKNKDPYERGRGRTLAKDDAIPWAYAQVPSLIAERRAFLNGLALEPKPVKPSGITFYPHQDDYTNHGPKPSTRPKRRRDSTIRGEHHRLTKLLLTQKRLNPGDEVKTSSCTLRELLAVAAHMDFTAEQTGRQRGRIYLHRQLEPMVAWYVKDKFGIVVVPVRLDDEALEAAA